MQEREGKPPFPPFADMDWDVEGKTWKEARMDVVISGLGWVSITVKGKVKFKTFTPKGVGLFAREDPLMPYETPTRTRKVPNLVKHHPGDLRQNQDLYAEFLSSQERTPIKTLDQLSTQ